MSYDEFNKSDFIEDARFRQWVQKPDAELEAFWQDFLERHPEKKQEVIAATNFLLSIEEQVEADKTSLAHEDAVFRRIQQRLEEGESTRVRRLPRWSAWLAAASALLALGLWFSDTSPRPGERLTYEASRRQSKKGLIEKVNVTSTPMIVSLADGSVISLQPRSRLSYAQDFGRDGEREVYLSGEAFFEVTKDPNKPFCVYANELTTKVLGTSFNVRAFENGEEVTVEVQTGRVTVAVDDRVARPEEISPREREGILLLPNQQAVLSRKEIRLVKTLVEKPVLLSQVVPGEPRYSFVFKAAPASEVFRTLEKAYGLNIVFDARNICPCQFTADLTDATPYEKLDILCRSIEAHYRILDAQIIVGGKGCEP